MVGRSGAVEELSGSVAGGGSGELRVADVAGAAETSAIPPGSRKVSPRSSEQEQGWRAAARHGTGDAGAAAGGVAFSARIRRDQLRKRDVAGSHAANDVARIRNGIPFSERTRRSRRAVLPRPAESPRSVCG